MLFTKACRHQFLLILLCIGFVACSAKKTAPTDEGEMDSSASVSSADKIENSTDDMLANESGESTEGEMKELNNSDDPFADLKAEEKVAANAENQSENKFSESNNVPATADSPAMPEASQPSSDVADLGNTAMPENNNAGGEQRIYTVKAGDTLMMIAYSIYGDLDRWRDLHDWNASKIKNPNRLTRGMKLKYEAPAEEFQVEEHAQNYVIKKGDTLAKIADEVYGRIRKWKKLQRYNARMIKNPNVIFAGFKLYYEITPLEIAEAQKRREEREAIAASKQNNSVLADTMNAKPVIAAEPAKRTAKPAEVAAQIGKKIEPVLNAGVQTLAPAVKAAEKIPSVITGSEVKPAQPAAVATVSPVTPVTPAPAPAAQPAVTPITK